MVIRVSEIPDEGVQIEGPECLPHPFTDPAWRLERLSLHIERDGDVVLARGTLTARLPLACGRCLEPFRMTVEPAVDARLVPAPAGRGEERELGSDDLETDVYMKDTLDIGALVETETALCLPMKPLCLPDCRGLCPVCGGNRNLTACDCEARSVDPRWAPLRTLADKLSK